MTRKRELIEHPCVTDAPKNVPRRTAGIMLDELNDLVGALDRLGVSYSRTSRRMTGVYWLRNQQETQLPAHDTVLRVGQTYLLFSQGSYLGLVWDEMMVYEPKEQHKKHKLSAKERRARGARGD